MLKRDLTLEECSFDKISQRIRRLGKFPGVDISRITSLVASSIVDGIATSRIDDLTADISISLSTEHPDYGLLAARIMVSNWHKQTSPSVVDTFEKMSDIVSPEFLDLVRVHGETLEGIVDYKRDEFFDWFGLATMKKIYCTKLDGVTVERPQHVYLRVALFLCGNDTKRLRETYALLSKHKYTHASPTLFNAGMKTSQLASCYLATTGDSLDDIFKAFHDVGRISKLGGGIGMDISTIRSKGSAIRGTNGVSDGIIPMLRVANTVISYVNQSGEWPRDTLEYCVPGQQTTNVSLFSGRVWSGYVV